MRIELSEFWSYSDEKKRSEYSQILTQPVEQLIDTRYVDDIWTLRNAAVDGAIVGFRRPDQVEPIIEAAGLQRQ